ncbi:MAG: helix-turn-helix domain-containing protein [Gammaproteobacteria bacterium]|nr:helix-turn-helix domain-containing protein [Gammaproteobacteria bacterium]
MSTDRNAAGRSPSPYRVGFILVPRFSMLAFSSGLEPLRMANRLADRPLYEWCLIGESKDDVEASNGLKLTPDTVFDEARDLHLLLVCGGVDIQQVADKALIGFLQRAAQRGLALGALCTGTYILAKSTVLDGYRCTIHWENLASMREAFPQVVLTTEVFEIDRDRLTSSGGSAPLDMMLHVIAGHHGQELANAISEVFICERIRGRHDRQRIPLRTRLGTSQPKLMEAVALMEANIEEPMSLDELAHHASLSRRQLERLFQKHLGCVPTRYYLELRLQRARQLLLQTSMSIVDVAFACGFVSAPHFSKCYRDFFSIPPRDERRRRKPADTTPAAQQKSVP